MFKRILQCTGILVLIVSVFLGLFLNGAFIGMGVRFFDLAFERFFQYVFFTTLLNTQLENVKRTKHNYPGALGLTPLIYTGEYGFNFEDIPDLTGKRALVTGANVGLGYYTSLHLARNGADVVLACRSEKKCNRAAETIRANITKGSVEVEIVDLGSFKSVKKFAKSVSEKYEETGLDILVLNAGFISTGLYLTEDGIESQWQVNHVSQMYLYEELQDALLLAASERGHATVTAVSSAAHYRAQIIPFSISEINSNENDYVPFGRYSETKLANVLFTMEAQRRIEELSKHVYVNSVHPGMVATEFVRESNVKVFVGEYFGKILYQFIKDVVARLSWDSETASLTQIYTAVSPEIQEKNIKATYFHPIARPVSKVSVLATSENAAKLWKSTKALLESKMR